jgi:hypothetical protein
MNKEKNDPWGEKTKSSRLYRVFIIILLSVIALYFWKLSIALVALVLILLWYAFSLTPSYNRPVEVDPDTGEEKISFYMGGEWADDYSPDYEDCVNAWAFMLSDAEETSFESDVEDKDRVISRAIHILQQASLCEAEPSHNVKSANTLSDLIALLQDNKKTSWLLDELLSRREALEFDLDVAIEKSRSSSVVDDLYGDWESKAKLIVDEVKSTIPVYTDKQIEDFAKKFAPIMLKAEDTLKIDFEVYDPASIKISADQDWGWNTVSQTGLSLFTGSWEMSHEDNFINYDLCEAIDYEVFNQRDTLRFDFLESRSSCTYGDKQVYLLAEVQDIAGGYMCTVKSPTYGPVDAFNEHEEVFVDGPSVWKVSISVGDDQIVFDLQNQNVQANNFVHSLGDFLSEKSSDE